MATKKDSKKEQESVLSTARERFKLAVEAETEIRKEALDDLNFRAGNQWPEDIKRSRDIDRRPCLTINRIPQFVRQVTNDQRQNRPAIRVSPVDDRADIETAKIYQGLIRHIEYNSNADVAYDTAFESAVTTGLGYFRIITDHVDPMSFDQEILFKRVVNASSVYLDPHFQEPDGSDANWGFIIEDLSRDDFKAQYPESKLSKMEEWESLGDRAPDWATDDSCRVAEYFCKTFKQTKIYQLNTGEVVTKEEFEKLSEELSDEELLNIEIVSERDTTLPAIKWYKINGIEILEETEWLSRWIPIIPVLGDELVIDGKRIFEGIIRHAKDPQRMYNYWASSETETIALAPRAPFIGAEGQFEGHEVQWATANQKNHAFLEYKPTTVNGQLAPAPQRNVFEPPIQAISQARMLSSEDLKATTGIYDSSLGAKSNENSGIAIQRRNMQSQTSNFHYVDNLTRSLRHAGRILLDLIPKVYDTPRAQRIIGEDGEEEIVRLNEIFESNGEPKIYDLSVGKYDITVDTGPSYATKRQEAVDSMLSLVQAYPQAAQFAGDLMIKNMDWPGAKEIAERLKKTLPPGIAEDEDGQQAPLPPEVQQQMQQMSQMIEQMTAQLNDATKTIEQKTLELESKERIEFAKMETDLEKEKLKAFSYEAVDSVNMQIADIERRLEFLRMNAPIDPGQQMPMQQQMLSEGNPQEFEMDAGGFPAEPPMNIDPEIEQQLTGGYSPGTPME